MQMKASSIALIRGASKSQIWKPRFARTLNLYLCCLLRLGLRELLEISRILQVGQGLCTSIAAVDTNVRTGCIA
jgi:hypothetical protein